MNKALTSALANFEIKDGELLIGGKKVSLLAAHHGTPLYIYDENIIRRKCKDLREILPDELKIYYAVKANPHLEIIKLMGELYDGFDVASAGEAERVIQAGIGSEKINFAGPGKSLAEILYAIEQQIGLSIENEQELDHIKEICGRIRKTAAVSVRVNPDFDLSQSGMKMGGGPKQFGIDAERVHPLIRSMKSDSNIHFKGIHIFAGSQNLSASALLHTFEQILKYAVSLVEDTGMPLEKLNMGGGFGIPYFAHEEELDIHAVGHGLKKLLLQYGSALKNTSFLIELGRFLVGGCGIYLARILYRKISKDHIFLITDGGMHHHLAASGNFGQSLVRRPMPITVANKLDAPLEKAHVVGPLCTPLDTFGYVQIPQAQEGDLIAVLNSGAYGFSASPLFFLTHPPPGELII
jgi:diaminopimelate decarboxylase